MRFISLVALCLSFASSAFGQESIGEQIAQIRASNATLEQRLSAPAPKAETLSYDAAMKLAAASGKHVVVLVGPNWLVPPNIEGAIGCISPELAGYPASCIVIAEPNGRGWMAHKRTLPDGTPASEIREVVRGEVTADADKAGMVDALDEVNATRAARGLPPYIRCEHLTFAAQSAARQRAAHRIAGHLANDFAHVPPDGWASGAGCAAWPASMGWGACLTYSQSHSHAGASYAIGSDGLRYMHLFVR